MNSSLISIQSPPPLQIFPTLTSPPRMIIPKMRIQSGSRLRNFFCFHSSPSSLQSGQGAFQKYVPLAATLAIILWSNPAKAGFLSGFPGIESVPGPQLPPIDFLNRFNEENQKKYAEADERFKSSPVLKQLLSRSKLNKEKNRQEILDKYCIRGAEWGVGDCSTAGMSLEDRDKFIAMLKEKAGVKD